MIDLIGLITRTWIGMQAGNAPATQHVGTIPLVGAPAAGSAAAAPTPAPAPAAKAVTADEVVNQVQKFYADIKQVDATFKQSVTNNTFGSTKSSSGHVLIKKPGKMRWDYIEKKKYTKSFISNGSYLYVVEHNNKQVMKKNLSNDLMPVAVTFLYGKGDLKTEFTAEFDATSKYGSKDDYVLKLTPKKPSAQYKNLILVVDKGQYRVKQSVIIDASNNINQFQFFNPNFTKDIADKFFEFDERSVKNYRIIDGDAPQQGAGAGSGSAMAPAAPAK